jgi:APA family basic amino acid/polyamine antiporter
MENSDATQGILKKTIGFWTATAIAIGVTVGSGVFVKPAKVLAQTGSSGLSLLAWAMGGLMAICGGLTVAEVAARIPKTGGIFIYIEELYGEKLGFLSGWVQTFIYGPGLIGALGLYFATLLCPALGLDKGLITPIAVATVLFLMIMNLLATKLGGFIQNITTVGKLLPIFAIFIFGMMSGHQNIFQTISINPAETSFASAVLSTLWAYDGWILVGNVAGEMENSRQNLPRAIVTGLVIVIIGYLGLNFALFHVLPAESIHSFAAEAPGKAAIEIFGDWGGKFVSLGILISIFGCLNGTILSSPRIPYAMAARGDIKNVTWLTKVHKKFNTPINAIIMQAVVGIIMIVLANPDQITDFAIFSVYIFYTMAFVGLFLLRKRNPNFDGYHCPLFPMIPVIAIVSSIYILISTVFNQPKIAIISLIITGVGYPVYMFIRNKEYKHVEAR